MKAHWSKAFNNLLNQIKKHKINVAEYIGMWLSNEFSSHKHQFPGAAPLADASILHFLLLNWHS